MTKQYVLGFAFDADRQNVVLIEKQRPDWQKGQMNGIGGKVEPSDASIKGAMIREFFEETGVQTELTDWHCYGQLTYAQDRTDPSYKAVVYLLRMFSDQVNDCSTVTDEEVVLGFVEGAVIGGYMFDTQCRMNLGLLIQLALQEEFQGVELAQWQES